VPLKILAGLNEVHQDGFKLPNIYIRILHKGSSYHVGALMYSSPWTNLSQQEKTWAKVLNLNVGK
jgi:hypothetical protein